MQFLLMLYSNEAGWDKMTQAEQEQGMAAYQAYTEALTKAGAIKGKNRLRPTSTATTVRLVDGKSHVLDGPYIESKEQLGGYYLIDVPDLDAAISWAARCPGAGHGIVEVRPRWLMERARARIHLRATSRLAAWLTRLRAAATASSSPFSPRARATWRRPKTRFPTRSWQRLKAGRSVVAPRILRPGCSPSLGEKSSICTGAGVPARVPSSSWNTVRTVSTPRNPMRLFPTIGLH